MIEAPRHLIRAGRGRVRVLRLVADGDHCLALAYTVPIGSGTCCRCGCTDRYGCGGGCAWANASHTICTRCLEKELLP